MAELKAEAEGGEAAEPLVLTWKGRKDGGREGREK